jgi:hypothetical protein
MLLRWLPAIRSKHSGSVVTTGHLSDTFLEIELNSSMTHHRNKLPTSFTLTPRTKDVLEAIAEYYGLTRTAAVEMMVRDRGRELGIIKGTPDVVLRQGSSRE